MRLVWKQGTSKSLDSLSSLYNIHPYVHIYTHICMYIWFSIYVCIGVIASSLHQTHAIWQQATRQSSSLLIYSNKICFNETFYGCPAWSNTLLNIISYWFYPSISHWLYIRVYIYIIIYHYIPVYPTDIPLISHWYPRPPCWNVLECTRASIVEPPFFVFELSWSHGIQIWKPKELIV